MSDCGSRNLCCVMCIPGFSFFIQKNPPWHIFWKMSVFTSKVLQSEGEHGRGAAFDCVSISCQENHVSASVKVVNICENSLYRQAKVVSWEKEISQGDKLIMEHNIINIYLHTHRMLLYTRTHTYAHIKMLSLACLLWEQTRVLQWEAWH